MKRLYIVLMAMALLTGCSADTALRNEIVVTALGIHQKNGACTLSVQSVEALKTAASLSEQDDTATAVYEASGDSVSAALLAFLSEAGRETYILQNRILAVSIAQCEALPLSDSVDYLIRNQEGRVLVPVVVCRGDPAELLGISSGNDAIPARYLVGMLEEGAEWGVCIQRDLLDVQRASSGMFDAVLPILSVSDGTPTPDGTALFRDGELVGELTAAQTTGLMLLGNELSRTRYTEGGVTYTLEAVKTKLTVTKDGQRFSYHFAVTGRVQITERQGGAEPTLSVVERFVKGCMDDTLSVLDTLDCDPLGLARKTAQQYTEVTQKTVRSQLKACDKTVSVKLTF